MTTVQPRRRRDSETVVARRAVIRRRTGHDIVAGLAAVVALVVLVLGIPVLLVVTSPLVWPTTLPAPASVLAALSGPDDGRLLWGALCLIAWLAWASFALSALLEVMAVVRRRATPRLPMMRLPQQAAAALVAAVALAISPVVLWSPAACSTPRAEATTPSTTVVAVTRLSHQVESAPGVEIPDTAQTRSVVVKRHDTLWGIAERYLGSGPRYKEILKLNRGRVQADGRALTDAHWIYPGWELRLPPVVVLPVRPLPARPVQLTAAAALVDRGSGADLLPTDLLPTHEPRAGSASGLPEIVDRAVSVGNPAAELMAASDELADSSADTEIPAALLVGGIGALSAVGLLAEVSRRRRRQHRIRTVGQRIPRQSESAGRLEQVARFRSRPILSGRVRDALAALAAGCEREGRSLPDVAVARVAADRLTLLLAQEDVAVVAPYRCVSAREWQVSYDEVPTGTDQQCPDPYPALCSVGTIGAELVLANLESAGSLTVSGRPQRTAPVLAAITTDLVSRSRTGQITVVVAGINGTALVGNGSRATPDLESAAREQHLQLKETAGVLHESVVVDVREARSRGVAEQACVPDVAIVPGPPEATPPWSGSVSVGTSDACGPAQSGWTLRPSQGSLWQLEPTDLFLLPHSLDIDQSAAAAELLREDPKVEMGTGLTWAGEIAAVLAALPPESAGTGIVAESVAPFVRVLGPVHVEGGNDAAAPGRRRRATEFTAYLVLYPGASRHTVDEVMWPGARVGRNTRNPFVSRVRQWLGRTEAGDPYLPLVPDEGEYRLRSDIGCDWWEFVHLVRRGLGCEPLDLPLLGEALQLVRGRPFQGVDPATYVWAEPAIHDMVGAIVDTAHVLAGARLMSGDARGAAAAAARGLLVDPGSELLHRDAIRAAQAVGDPAEVRRSVARLRAEMDDIDPDGDLAEETVSLLRQLDM
jgi:hypothetical protein